MSTDEQLANRCFAPERDESACSELYEKYKRIAVNLAWRFLDDVHEAQDAFHNAWYSLLHKREFEHFKNFRAYLFQTVRNHARMILRKRHTHRVDFHVDLDSPVSNSDSSADRMRLHESIEDKKATLDRQNRELRRDIELVLERELHRTYYRAYRLVSRNGLTYSEAAKILGFSTKKIQRIYNVVEEILIKYDLIPRKKKREDKDEPSSS
ncbi:MAG: sigma-70 family RNA polymerase sigma factor [bacterium]